MWYNIPSSLWHTQTWAKECMQFWDCSQEYLSIKDFTSKPKCTSVETRKLRILSPKFLSLANLSLSLPHWQVNPSAHILVHLFLYLWAWIPVYPLQSPKPWTFKFCIINLFWDWLNMPVKGELRRIQPVRGQRSSHTFIGYKNKIRKHS